ncbi:MAG: transcription-repair coupling factor [Clostridiales bacterium]|nr:transcription-repair coupling factor [Clostridiales bacterium]
MKFLSKKIEKILKNQVISGVKEGEKIVISNHFQRLIFLCNNFVSAGKIKRGLEAFGKRVEIVSSARENQDENDKNLLPFVENLNKYIAGEIDCLIVLPCSAIIKFDKEALVPFGLKLGQEIQRAELTNRLVSMGYERSSLAQLPGQFAVRGDILDVFVTTGEHPIRVEFFDDIIENISIFDENNMKNLKKIDFCEVYASKLPIGEDCIFDLEGEKILDEPKRINEEIEMLITSYKATSFFNHKFYQDFDNLLDKADLTFDNFHILNEGYHNNMIAVQSYLTDFMALKTDIYDFKNLNQAIILFAGEERFKRNLESFLTENGFAYRDYDENCDLVNGQIYLSSLAMPYSFSFLKENVVAIGCDSLFRSSSSTFSKSKHSLFYLPKVGEYIVHTFHGIGKCVKIERLKISDIEKDYFVIEYKKGDILYLPSEEANTLSAYVGSEEEPKLSTLGGTEFTRLKERVKASIKEMAISLVEIYKERQLVKGYAFSRDEDLEKQFADSFGYPETPDQLKAISDIDKDMESDKVMERLICGDVGFGKTEVALRGAFKCIYNGKQVALVCPTTILSEQHYRTAKERFSQFGIRIEVINRFRTELQVKDILRRLAEGKVDMIIGTHRLLSDDIVFNDLGLLILDEEQRFGVEHKEKIKDRSRNIDVLTLSATPIPRTLNMSLSGIRDISIIETPPRERLPIQTYVAEESDQLIKDVLSRELARGGQAFIVYNRVETIEEFASYIRNLVPQANIGVAHGQMTERALEKVVTQLYDGKFNILIATTLIENGINLPSANTMVVIDSDRLGLSQLYQIRGRIGRSDKLSYAYLTYQKDKHLTDDAYKRLEAIKEFSQLGSGFKIAMRDLELRGAGNILGKQQHGHIAKVGYDMFVRLLDEQVKEIKGEKVRKKSDVKLEIALSAYISEDYIEQGEQRIVYYTRISEISTIKERNEIIDSIRDGFGQVPQELVNLCNFALLRNLAGEFGVKRIVINKLENMIILEKQENILDKRLSQVLESSEGRLSFDSFVKIKFKPASSVAESLKCMIDFFLKAQEVQVK